MIIPRRVCTGAIATLLLFALCLTMDLARPAQAAAVVGVRVGEAQGDTRVVIELSGPASYRAFVLSGPARLVVDVKGGWIRTDLAGLGGGIVRQIRTGAPSSDLARIVFDAKGQLSIVRKFFLEARAGRPDRLVVDVRPEGEQFPVNSVTSQGKYTVIVDPGHGGKDPGALGAGGKVREKDLNLAAARQLRDILQERGYRVVLTRDRDVYIPLRERVRIGQRAGGDLFVSLHADSAGRASARGLSVYSLSEKASDNLAARLAEHANKSDIIAGINPKAYDEEVLGVLIDLTRTGTQNQSAQFAESLVGHLEGKKVRLLPRPHRQAGFAVLKGFDIPSVLIEMGFVSNREDAKALSSANYRKRLMTAVADHLDRHFKSRVARGY